MRVWLGVLALGVVFYLAWGIIGMVGSDLSFKEAFLDFGSYSLAIALVGFGGFGSLLYKYKSSQAAH